MQRMGMLINIKADKLADYKALHAAVWPDVLEQIKNSHIRNYSIFLREPENLLFGYWEYHGKDFAGDMATMAQDPITQKWWTFTDPCQTPLASAANGEQWSMMQEIFHTD